MRRMNRRQFAKLAGGATLMAPLAVAARGEPWASRLAWAQEPLKKPERAPAKPTPTQNELQQPAEASKSEPRLRLSPEQEDAVKKAVERRDRQLAALRSRVLPYNAEPAFVFQVRQHPRSGRKI